VVRADSLLKPHQRFCYVSTLVLAQGNWFFICLSRTET
jgi:hypothetical protein